MSTPTDAEPFRPTASSRPAEGARSPDQGRAANIRDVARRAGVSHQTVSRVINNHTSVRESTRQRVQRAVEQLSYRPSAAARALTSA